MMQHAEIVGWLREARPERLAELWRTADRVRQENVGGEVFLRGLIEISNYCVRLCAYCGLRAANAGLPRYRMSAEEILGCAGQAKSFGYGTVVLQSGEDPGLESAAVVEVVRTIKREYGLAITLSLGERTDDELRAWRAAGADRYLMRFETSNRELYERIHPPRPGRTNDRLGILRRIRAMGYEVGSGVMIGIPGQSYDDLARDIELFAELDLDMIGVGPYLTHPDTPLGSGQPSLESGQQVPNTEAMTYKVIALARLVCPRANIPATTALATLNRAQGRELGLVRGANVIMPNLTPPLYRAMYEIYPNKACVQETGEACFSCVTQRIESLGRSVGGGPGDSPNVRQRRGQEEAAKQAEHPRIHHNP